MDGVSVQEQIKSRLQPLRQHGWKVDVEDVFEGNEYVTFYVEHPLSIRSGFSLRISGNGLDPVLERILNSREVAVIAGAPATMTHTSSFSVRSATRQERGSGLSR